MSHQWRPGLGTYDLAELESADLLPTFETLDEAEQ